MDINYTPKRTKKRTKKKKYAVVQSDGCNGPCFDGIATLKELRKQFPEMTRDNGVYHLDEEGMVFAVPVTGRAWKPEVIDEG